MNFMPVEKAAGKWGVTRRHVQLLCSRGRVDGAVKLSGVWMIPAGSEKPPDGRLKNILQLKMPAHTEGEHGKHE